MKRLLPILLLLAVACTRPASTETFIRGNGPYAFTVDMADSTAAYDFDLYTRVDRSDSPSQLLLDITWKAPSDSTFTESVYLPLTRGASFFSRDAYAPYRAGVVPVENGVWTVTVAVPNPPEGLCGMGLVVRHSSPASQVVDTQ